MLHEKSPGFQCIGGNIKLPETPRLKIDSDALQKQKRQLGEGGLPVLRIWGSSQVTSEDSQFSSGPGVISRHCAVCLCVVRVLEFP